MTWAAPRPLPALLLQARPNQVPEFQQLCDFAVVASKLQTLPVADDPVFRPPSPQAKAELGRVRKAVLGGNVGDAALQALFAGPEGPTLARMALQDRDPRVQLTAVRQAAILAEKHPRLFGFLPTLDAKTQVDLAEALVRFDFATHCDTPVLFALDGLRHPDPTIVGLVVHQTLALAAHLRHPAPLNRLVDWLVTPAGHPRLRAATLRSLGEAGYLHLVPALQLLRNSTQRMVANEALVALAVSAPLEVVQQVPALVASPLADGVATGLRVARVTHAHDPGKLLMTVTALQRSKQVWRDPVTGQGVPIGVLARQVLAAWALDPDSILRHGAK